MADDNPFAKFKPPTADNPFAKFKPGATAAEPTEDVGVFGGMAQGTDTLAAIGRGIKQGIADPLYKGAQIGARMGPEIGGAAFETPEQTQGRTQAVDTATQQREQAFEREGAVKQHPAVAEFGRIAGQILSEAPTAAAAGAAAPEAALGRIGLSSAIGAAGAASGQPVPNAQQAGIGIPTAKQAAGGGVGGAAGGALAEGIGALAGRLMGRGAPATPQETLQRFQRAAPMSPGGINTNQAIADMQQARLTGANLIRREMPNELPQTRIQLSEALSRAKASLLNKYKPMAEQAEGAAAVNPTSINKFRNAFHDASDKLAVAKTDLDMARLKLEAELRSPSGQSTGSIRTAKKALDKAELNFKSAEAERVGASREMQRTWVDLKPIADDLDRFADTDALKITPGAGYQGEGKTPSGIIKYAKDEAAKYRDIEAGSPQAVEQAITNANNALKAFYQSPSYETADRAAVNAMIANRMRKGLDDTITQTVGPGYQQFKLEYGALSAIEKDVTRAAIRQMGNTPEARLLEGLVNVGTTEELVRTITMLHAEPAARALLVRGARALKNYFDSPDRQVRLMFQGMERQPMSSAIQYSFPPIGGSIGGAVGGQRETEPPPRFTGDRPRF